MAKSLTPEDVKSLSDEELSALLRGYGVDVGPIIITTREVYERKLSRLIRGETLMEYDDACPDYDDDVTVVSPALPMPASRTPPGYEPVRRRFKDDPDAPSPRVPVERDTKSWFVQQAQNTAQQTMSSSAQVDGGAGGGRLWLKIIVAICVLALVYLVYLNMEETTEKPSEVKEPLPNV